VRQQVFGTLGCHLCLRHPEQAVVAGILCQDCANLLTQALTFGN
jgi:hypothetical protein